MKTGKGPSDKKGYQRLKKTAEKLFRVLCGFLRFEIKAALCNYMSGNYKLFLTKQQENS